MTPEAHMQRALDLALCQKGRTGRNPSVGCVLIDQSGKLLSEAATGDGGRPHAEQLALSGLTPELTRGGTAFVTLEPCRQRSTDEAACSDRLISAGFAMVFVSTLDPHPQGRGGIERLKAAGLKVETGLLKPQADLFYADFFKDVREQIRKS